jgi:hypothetical protein
MTPGDAGAAPSSLALDPYRADADAVLAAARARAAEIR